MSCLKRNEFNRKASPSVPPPNNPSAAPHHSTAPTAQNDNVQSAQQHSAQTAHQPHHHRRSPHELGLRQNLRAPLIVGDCLGFQSTQTVFRVTLADVGTELWIDRANSLGAKSRQETCAMTRGDAEKLRMRMERDIQNQKRITNATNDLWFYDQQYGNALQAALIAHGMPDGQEAKATAQADQFWNEGMRVKYRPVP